MKKSIKVNAILNVLKTCVTIFVPLISYPYVSHILSINDFGKINFTNSIISYFLLLASLGIPTYAIREAVALHSKSDRDTFISEMFSMNLFFTLLSYLGLFFLYLICPPLHKYKNLLIIQSLTIGFTTIGLDWVNNIDEDFLFLSIRTVLIQFLSLFAIFIFIRHENDYICYAIISTLAILITNLINYFYIRRNHSIRIIKFDMNKHIIPVLIIFFNTVAITIYSNSDSTMLGIFCDDYRVGIYNLASKIYAIMKTLFSAIYVAVLPRVVKYLNKNDKFRFNELLHNTFHILLVILLPSVIGMVSLSKNIVYIVGGQKYHDSVVPLIILTIALLFAMFSNFISTLILIPKKKERKVCIATAIGACVNVVLNLIFIPCIGEIGASITTLIAEIAVFFLLYLDLSDKSIFSIRKNDLFALLVGNTLVIIIIILIKKLCLSIYVTLLGSMFASIIIYFFVLMVMNESEVTDFIINRRKK